MSTTLTTVYNTQATRELKTLFDGEDYFDFPKPVDYIKLIIEQGAADGGIVLDFFSGSATTAHAVMQLNAEDKGHRKFIMVQLPETTDEKSEAHKAGYKTICEIGRNASAVRERKFKKKGLKQSHSLNTSGIKPASMWNIKKNVTGLGIFLMNTLQKSTLLLIPVSVF